MSEPKTLAELRSMPDADVVALYDSKKGAGYITVPDQLLHELERRDQDKQSEASLELAKRQEEQSRTMLELTKSMDRYTKKVTTLTAVATVAAVIGAIAAIIALFK